MVVTGIRLEGKIDKKRTIIQNDMRLVLRKGKKSPELTWKMLLLVYYCFRPL